MNSTPIIVGPQAYLARGWPWERISCPLTDQPSSQIYTCKMADGDEGEREVKRRKFSTDADNIDNTGVAPCQNILLSGIAGNDDKGKEEIADSAVKCEEEDEASIPTKRAVSEHEVGIVEHLSGHQGFHGVLKQRYVDFLVNERDLEGNLIRLRDTSVPKPEASSDCATEQLEDGVIGDEDMQSIRQVLESDDPSLSATLIADDNKEHRTRVHRAIRARFASVLGWSQLASVNQSINQYLNF